MLKRILRKLAGNKFSSKNYWEHRYTSGGNSGQGSYGEQAEAKAKVVNEIVDRFGIKTVVELGSGDGNQLTYANYEKYTGLDVSPKAISIASELFKDDSAKSFHLYDASAFDPAVYQSDLALSLEVVFHLVEKQVYLTYLDHLFALAKQYVIIFSTHRDQKIHTDKHGVSTPHITHREFSKDIKKRYQDFELLEIIENPYEPKADMQFYLYKRVR